MDTALLGLRVALSLACVLGLIWFAGRRLQGSGVVRKQRAVPLSVLGRQSLGKGSGIALVEVAGRVLLVGIGEAGVTLLTEVDVARAPGAPATAPGDDAGQRAGERAGERAAEVREEIDLAVVAAADPSVLVAVPSDGLESLARDFGLEPAPAAAQAATPQPLDGARTAALAGLGLTGAPAGGALQGSALSPDTWRRAVDVVQRRTARR